MSETQIFFIGYLTGIVTGGAIANIIFWKKDMSTDKELLAMCDDVINSLGGPDNGEDEPIYKLAVYAKRHLKTGEREKIEPQSKTQFKRMTTQGWTSDREKALLEAVRLQNNMWHSPLVTQALAAYEDGK